MQILTTVGYGDLTPQTNYGKVFMVFYALTGVTLVASVLQELVFGYMLQSEKKAVTSYSTFFGRYKEFFRALVPVILCIIFSTAFYSMYPGEQKSVFEAFYMSVITSLTIGFGAYHPITQLGMLIGSVWMFISVVYTGQAIVTLTDNLFQHRLHVKSSINIKKLFSELCASRGAVDEVTFLKFELIRSGVSSALVTDCNDAFKKLDEDNSGSLDFSHFESYLTSVDSHIGLHGMGHVNRPG
jgi:potassium channel subfamily K